MKRGSVWLIALAGPLFAALIFLPVLDRYPIPFGDEGFWSWPAANYLLHGSFTYAQGPSAPHGQQVWAYHAPLFPRAQIWVLSLFGISTFAVRVLSYVSASLGHLLLSLVLLRRGHGWVAAACALAWLGDRSLMHTLHGRVEGLALFWGLCGFCALFEALESADRGTGRLLGLAGFVLGLAAVTHMVTVLWFAAALVAIGWEADRNHRWSAMGKLLGGWTLGGGLGLLPLASHPREACEQFAWFFTHLGQGMSLGEKWALVHQKLFWARPWLSALIIGTLVVAMTWKRPCRVDEASPEAPSSCRLARLATLFAVFSLPVFLQRGFYEYYLVYFTSWATLAIAASLAEEVQAGRGTRLALGLAAVVAAAWFPSALWNALRVREAYTLREAMDPRPFQKELRQRILAAPEGSSLQGTAWLFPWAVQAGIDFRPLSYLDVPVPFKPGVWLLMTTAHWQELVEAGDVEPQRYQVIWRTDVYRGRYSFPYEVLLLAPKGLAPREKPTLPAH